VVALGEFGATAFLARADDIDDVKTTLRHAVTVTRRAGGTKAAVWLNELNTHAERVDHAKVLPLLTVLFEIADEINVEADSAKAFSIGSNELRLHWLLRALTKEHMSLDERSTLFRRACDTASLSWLANFTRSAWTDYHPREGKEREPPENCLTTEVDAEQLRVNLRSRIEATAANGTLLAHRDLPFLLYSWVDLTTDDGAAVRDWTSAAFTTDDGVRLLAKAFTSYSWTQGMGFAGMGDAVAKRVTQVSPTGMARLMNLDAFRARVEAVAAAGGNPEVQEFLEAWRRAYRGDRDWRTTGHPGQITLFKKKATQSHPHTPPPPTPPPRQRNPDLHQPRQPRWASRQCPTPDTGVRGAGALFQVAGLL